MKRSFTFVAALSLFALTLVAPYATRKVGAVPPDKCVKCLQKLEREFEKCEEQNGVGQFCYDLFNAGIVECYATVCEQ